MKVQFDRSRQGLLLRACLLAATAAAPRLAPAESVVVMPGGNVSPWTEKRFVGRTLYETISLDGREALRARSSRSASGVFRRIRIDISQTPVLTWTWRVENTLPAVDEKTRDGDDFPARVLVIHRHPVFFWMNRVLSYVWSSSQPRGRAWTNPHTRSVQQIAVRSGSADAGRWLTERRDVRADFRRLFGSDIRHVDAVAVMTDTDNSGSSAVAYYADIRFRSE